MKDYNAILSPDHFYHVYNRANGDDKLFNTTDNYNYFLTKYKFYLHSIVDTYAYCLMPNHFHFIVKIKDDHSIEEHLHNLYKNDKMKKILQGFQAFAGLDQQKFMSKFITKQWSNLFNSYTQAFNKVNHRKGSLFMRNFKRIKITDDKYLVKLIHYVHYNPVQAGLASKPQNWKYSSYASLVSNKPTNLMRNQVIELFDDVENFKFCHRRIPEVSGIHDMF